MMYTTYEMDELELTVSGHGTGSYVPVRIECYFDEDGQVWVVDRVELKGYIERVLMRDHYGNPYQYDEVYTRIDDVPGFEGIVSSAEHHISSNQHLLPEIQELINDL